MLARLFDGSAYIHRAFHAMPAMERPSDGHPVGAINGFCRTLLKLTSPSYRAAPARFTAVIFDATRDNWRNSTYPEYKAHRPPMDDALRAQMPLMREAARAFGLSAIEAAGYEADDILATYARLFTEEGIDVEIVTGDKDLTQLMRPPMDGLGGVTVHDPFADENRGRILEVEDVIKKFGVGPSLVRDSLALQGDATDNVPGVPGVGVKTAAKLLHAYGSLEGVLANAENASTPKLRATLTDPANQELARISYKIVGLEENVPLTLLEPPSELEYYAPDMAEVREFFERMEFPALVDRVKELAA